MTSNPRAVAVVRVSAQGERPEEHFHSPDVQLASAKRWARKRRERPLAGPAPLDRAGMAAVAVRVGVALAIARLRVGAAAAADADVARLDRARLLPGGIPSV